ncbi:hypothetical protein RJ640_018874, partial [Escallonia rubra]
VLLSLSSSLSTMEVPTPTPCWSNIVKQQPPPPPNRNHHSSAAAAATASAAAAERVLVGSCKSTEGIVVAVVDANAIIQGGEKLARAAGKFVSVTEVMHEVRDPASRHSLNLLPFSVDPLEPSPESLKKVINFARATGDLQTLSDVDLKLIALTYTLEAQMHGTKHLRDDPPPIHTVNVKRLPEKDLPGWGSNVPNLEEWEALENAVEDKSNQNSRILPLKDLNLNVIPEDRHQNAEDGLVGDENQDDRAGNFSKPKRYLTKKKEVNIEGKTMVAAGVDASQGQYDDNADDWRPAVSRSTHRRFLRRKARREMYETSSEQDGQQDASVDMKCENSEDLKCPDLPMHENLKETLVENGNPEESKIVEGEDDNEDLSTILNQMRLEEDSLTALQDSKEQNVSCEGQESNDFTCDDSEYIGGEGDAVEGVDKGLEHLDVTSQTSESLDASYIDDKSSEQSWMLRSLSESTVACITSDFAMQNVLLQMGLRLLAPGGMQIRELHRWILKCHACYKVTTEIGRIFCPNCGNGGTLRKVAVTVGENGIVLAARRPRISVRGTKGIYYFLEALFDMAEGVLKDDHIPNSGYMVILPVHALAGVWVHVLCFSLPLPQGGRDAITKNPILREDQLPQKFLYPKTKKKNKQDDDIFASNDLFLHHTDKKAPLRPPVRKALAVFSGRRNPNDNHFSRSMH